MNSTASNIERMRAAIVAFLAFAFLAVAMASAYAMPCSGTHGAIASHVHATAKSAHSHAGQDGSGKAAHDMRLGGCCMVMCGACGVMPDGNPEPLRMSINAAHERPSVGQVAGIIVGPPHGPPRS